MELKDIVVESLSFPFYNIDKLLIFVIFVFVGNLFLILIFLNPTLYAQYEFQKMIVPYSDIFNLISIISLIFVLGYGLSIFKNSINLYFGMPNYSLMNDFINGLKHLAIILFYFSIPMLLFFILSNFTGQSFYNFNLAYHFGTESIINQTADSVILIIKPLIPNLFELIKIISCGFILLIFGLIESVAAYRFVKYDELSEAFNLFSVFEDVYTLNLKLIGRFAILIVIISIMIFIFSVINKFYGGLIVTLFGYSYLIVVYFRFLGLLYSGA